MNADQAKQLFTAEARSRGEEQKQKALPLINMDNTDQKTGKPTARAFSLVSVVKVLLFQICVISVDQY